MDLKTAKVFKCLEKKTLMFGFEIIDVFALCILLSTLNLVFATADWKLFYTWGPTVIVSIILRVGKRGKPDNYIFHWLRYQFSPGVYSAFPMVRDLRIRRRRPSLARRLNQYE